MYKELSKSYNPEIAQKRWYQVWQQAGAFKPNQSGPAYSIVIPPPNVTGVLHMGHALNSTLQDILVRYHRMNGFATLWIPGMDHAGIATQSVVEKSLAEQNISKYDLGREKFVENVWEWKKKHGGIIQQQLREMGHSPDWSNDRFTLDDGLSQAVRKVFVCLYQEGLIYRGERIINWSPKLRTALSDEEVDHKEIKGKLYYIRYPIQESDQFVEIATTRPETMLGDTAVAYNPKDERYQHLKGKKAILPLVYRAIPFVADDFVDPEFGSGLVKVTPAHDPNDFEIGKRHSLEEINILTDTGHINENGGIYKGLYRFQARKKIVEDLETAGLMIKIEDHTHAVGHCYRTGDMVEPYLTKQWFVSMKPLAEPAIEAVASGRISFHPPNWQKTYTHWMENIRDWCISRQLWWGHRIPAWYCSDCLGVTVSESDVNQCCHCQSRNIKQDEDVLDTWFSSALWPFSTMGWPNHSEMLSKFYPTSVLVTAFDIIFFWVARMVMMGLKFMNDVPFRDVLIHGLVLDEYGQKQSKSKGNVVNPLEMMYKYGTDAFRFTIASASSQGRGIRWNENTVSGYRHFANKIWNASRFIFNVVGLQSKNVYELRKLPAVADLRAYDHWIIGRLRFTILQMDQDIKKYRLGEATARVYDFVWKEFCDWYIEVSKNSLKEESPSILKENTLRVLVFILENIVKLLHPFMPFISEEIFSYLHAHEPEKKLEKGKLLISSIWPRPDDLDEYINEKSEQEVSLLMQIIYQIRKLRGEMNIPPDTLLQAILIPNQATKTETKDIITKAAESDKKNNTNISSDGVSHKIDFALLSQVIDCHGYQICSLAKLSAISSDSDYQPDKSEVVLALPGASMAIPLAGIIDVAKEKERISKELGKVSQDLTRVNDKLSNAKFVESAPEAIVAAQRQKQQELQDLQVRLQQSLLDLG